MAEGQEAPQGRVGQAEQRSVGVDIPGTAPLVVVGRADLQTPGTQTVLAGAARAAEARRREPISTLFGSIYLGGLGGETAEVYIGLSASDNLVLTSQVGEVDSEQLADHQHHLSSDMRVDLRTAGVEMIAPVVMDLGGAHEEQTMRLIEGTQGRIGLFLGPASRIGSYEYQANEERFTISLDGLLQSFRSDALPSFVQFQVPGEKESRVAMVLRDPQHPGEARLIFFRAQRTDVERARGGETSNWAVAHTALERIIRTVTAAEPGKYDQLLEKLHKSADYQKEKRAFVKELMELQTIADAHFGGPRPKRNWIERVRERIRPVQPRYQERVQHLLVNPNGHTVSAEGRQHPWLIEPYRIGQDPRVAEVFREIDGTLGAPRNWTEKRLANYAQAFLRAVEKHPVNTEALYQGTVDRLVYMVKGYGRLLPISVPKHDYHVFAVAMQHIGFLVLHDQVGEQVEEGNFEQMDRVVHEIQTQVGSSLRDSWLSLAFRAAVRTQEPEVYGRIYDYLYQKCLGLPNQDLESYLSVTDAKSSSYEDYRNNPSGWQSGYPAIQRFWFEQSLNNLLRFLRGPLASYKDEHAPTEISGQFRDIC